MIEIKDAQYQLPQGIVEISSLINRDKFLEALQRIDNYETQNPIDKSLMINKPGFLIDI